MNPLLAAIPLQVANELNNVRLLGKTKPEKNNARDSYDALANAFDERVRQVAPDAGQSYINIQESTPSSFDEARRLGVLLAGNKRVLSPDGKEGHEIYINPNTDRAYMAHELGHAVSDKTKIGNIVRTLRSNPKVGQALAASMLIAPGAVAAVTPGDDDVLGATALALAANSPTLIDEALATKNAFAIMDTADMRANLGQRGKLAGGMLSYLGVPIVAGLSSSLTGNIFDEPSPTELTP